jgi:hypothetical protein
MTDTMTSQNIDVSSWDTLYICDGVRLNPSVLRPQMGPLYRSRMVDERMKSLVE